MPRQPSGRPTDSELAILRVLWQHGPSTVRAVYDQLQLAKPTGYTTVLKILQIMFAKRLVTRDESSQTHIYAAAAAEKQTQRLLLKDLADRAFGGSARRLILGALSVKKISPAELAEIRALLSKLEDDE